MTSTRAFAAVALLCLAVHPAQAQEVNLQITVKDHRFQPSELHAPAGKPVTITIKNLDPIPMEFESKMLRFEKVITPNSSGTVRMKALEKGRYRFYDDFHDSTQGALVVE